MCNTYISRLAKNILIVIVGVIGPLHRIEGVEPSLQLSKWWSMGRLVCQASKQQGDDDGTDVGYIHQFFTVGKKWGDLSVVYIIDDVVRGRMANISNCIRFIQGTSRFERVRWRTSCYQSVHALFTKLGSTSIRL